MIAVSGHGLKEGSLPGEGNEMSILRVMVSAGIVAAGAAFAAEEAVSIPGSQYELPGILATPDTGSNYPGVLLIHGFASDKNEVGGFYSNLAALLADHGIASLRFDFPGSGDHATGFEVNNWSTFTRDADEAFDWIASQDGIDGERLAIVGFSLGGAIASNLAGNDDRVAALVLWSASGHMGSSQTDLYDTYYETAAAEGFAEADLGFRTANLSAEYFEGRFSAFPLFDIRSYTNPLLVVNGLLDTSVPVHTARDYVQSAGSLDVTLRILPESDHIFNVLSGDTTDSETVLQLTADWLDEKLN